MLFSCILHLLIQFILLISDLRVILWESVILAYKVTTRECFLCVHFKLFGVSLIVFWFPNNLIFLLQYFNNAAVHTNRENICCTKYELLSCSILIHGNPSPCAMDKSIISCIQTQRWISTILKYGEIHTGYLVLCIIIGIHTTNVTGFEKRYLFHTQNLTQTLEVHNFWIIQLIRPNFPCTKLH